jgi:hypothetical protein
MGSLTNNRINEKIENLIKGKNILIVSQRASGKTMLLSDIVHKLYGTYDCKCYKCAPYNVQVCGQRWETPMLNVYEDLSMDDHLLIANSRFHNHIVILIGQSFKMYSPAVTAQFDVAIIGNIRNTTVAEKQSIHDSFFKGMPFSEFENLFVNLKNYEFLVVDKQSGNWEIIKEQ